MRTACGSGARRGVREHPGGLTATSVHEAVARRLRLSDTERSKLVSGGQQALHRHRGAIAHEHLRRAGLSERSTLDVWQLTPAGRTFVDAHPTPLGDADVARLMDLSTQHRAAAWRERLSAFRGDTVWTAQLERANAARRRVLPEIRAFLERYLHGDVTLEDLRSTFDHNTRREWSDFGAKGPSGAMALNQLAKHAPDPAQADAALKALLRRPDDEEGAAAAIRAFRAFLADARARATTGARLPPDSRLRFLSSFFWHVQDPEVWPPFYETARAALSADGLLDAADLDVADEYLAFRRSFLDLQKALDVSGSDLSTLLRWTQRDTGAAAPAKPDVEEPEDANAARVWLIALGRNADQWEACHREGVISIGWSALGDLGAFGSVEEIRAKLREDREDDVDPMNAGLACWQFAHEMREGDTVYVKRGRHYIVGHGVITSAYRYEAHRLHAHLREVRWLGRGEWRPREKALAMKTLTEIGRYPALVSDIRTAIAAKDDEEREIPPGPAPGGRARRGRRLRGPFRRGTAGTRVPRRIETHPSSASRSRIPGRAPRAPETEGQDPPDRTRFPG